MSPKEKRFVEEYPRDLNGTKAAIRAGYTERSARVTAAKLLAKPNIRAAVDKTIDARSKRTGITADRVLKETEVLAFSDIEHYTLDDAGYLCAAPGAPEGVMRAVSSVKYKTTTRGAGDNKETERVCEFRLWDKPGVLKLAGRHVDVNGFWERMEHTGKNGADLAAVVVYIPDNGRDGND